MRLGGQEKQKQICPLGALTDLMSAAEETEGGKGRHEYVSLRPTRRSELIARTPIPSCTSTSAAFA